MAKFQKGQSGNPGGRPKVIAEIQELAREQTTKALDTLVSIMEDTEASPAARVSAACAILDRGYGKPAQFIAARSLERKAAELSDDELMAIAMSGREEEPAES